MCPQDTCKLPPVLLIWRIVLQDVVLHPTLLHMERAYIDLNGRQCDEPACCREWRRVHGATTASSPKRRRIAEQLRDAIEDVEDVAQGGRHMADIHVCNIACTTLHPSTLRTIAFDTKPLQGNISQRGASYGRAGKVSTRGRASRRRVLLKFE